MSSFYRFKTLLAFIVLALFVESVTATELLCPWPDMPEADPQLVELAYGDPPAQLEASNCFCTTNSALLIQQMNALSSDPAFGSDRNLVGFVESSNNDASFAARSLVDKYVRDGMFANVNSVQFTLDPPKSKSKVTYKQRIQYCIHEYYVSV